MRPAPALLAVVLMAAPLMSRGADPHKNLDPKFQTSDRCLACHNGLTTSTGEDISIGFDWRASMMANSSRDPYWQGSVRRESIDHPESIKAIEDECSICHMPMARYDAKLKGQEGQVFSHLPFDSGKKEDKLAVDGVSCSLCHQISKQKLGTRESFVGGFVLDTPDSKDERPVYGPFKIEKGQQRIMRTSSGGFRPTESDHIRQSEVCATCHTLITKALGPKGEVIGELNEQMPYQEWLHSDFKDKQSCQNCHMPVVKEDVPIARVLAKPREGFSRHVFAGGNFFMLRMLNRFRNDLSVDAQPQEMSVGAERSITYLQTQAAKISIDRVEVGSGRLEAEVSLVNLGGHKLPTAYPSRRAWLHVVVRDRANQVVFESGAVQPDGSIRGNDNDADGTRFEPHYTQITSPDQVQIYESILGGADGKVTTGLLTATGYLKDNRLLPRGFDKRTADKEVGVVGEAANDPDFTDAGDKVRYSIPIGGAQGPFQVEAELWFQPTGYRWANNLKKYNAEEPRRFTGYYDAMSSASAVMMVRATAAK